MRALLISSFVALLVASAQPGYAQCTGGPSQCGSWSQRYTWFPADGKGEVVHASLLPTGPAAGQVLLWRSNWLGGCPLNNAPTWIWNPSSPDTISARSGTVQHNIFCASHAYLPDGRLLVVGGTNNGAASCPPPQYPNYSHVFNTLSPFVAPAYSPWSAAIWLDAALGANGCDARYYPIVKELANGTMLVGGGSVGDPTTLPPPPGCSLPGAGPSAAFDNTYRYFDATTATWSNPPSPGLMGTTVPSGNAASLWWYTYMHLRSSAPASGGSAFFLAQAGTHNDAEGGSPQSNVHAYLLDTGTGVAQNPLALANSSVTRKYASSVMEPKMTVGAPDVVYLFGGAVPGLFPVVCTDAYNTAERIVLTGDPATWAWNPPMIMGPSTPEAPGRVFQNAVILPDGTILIVGGTRIDYQNCTLPFGETTQAVLDPALFDPQTQTWATMAAHSSPRRYHSTALLLTDGRVLCAGGQQKGEPSLPESDAEIFSPPYLFRGPRPDITLAPASISYGAPVEIKALTTLGGTGIDKVVLVRPGSVTHHFDPEQKLIALQIQQIVSGWVPGSNLVHHTITVTGPGDGYAAPPGFYMLFVLADGMIPSIAEFVHVP